MATPERDVFLTLAKAALETGQAKVGPEKGDRPPLYSVYDYVPEPGPTLVTFKPRHERHTYYTVHSPDAAVDTDALLSAALEGQFVFRRLLSVPAARARLRALVDSLERKEGRISMGSDKDVVRPRNTFQHTAVVEGLMHGRFEDDTAIPVAIAATEILENDIPMRDPGGEAEEFCEVWAYGDDPLATLIARYYDFGTSASVSIYLPTVLEAEQDAIAQDLVRVLIPRGLHAAKGERTAAPSALKPLPASKVRARLQTLLAALVDDPGFQLALPLIGRPSDETVNWVTWLRHSDEQEAEMSTSLQDPLRNPLPRTSMEEAAGAEPVEEEDDEEAGVGELGRDRATVQHVARLAKEILDGRAPAFDPRTGIGPQGAFEVFGVENSPLATLIVRHHGMDQAQSLALFMTTEDLAMRRAAILRALKRFIAYRGWAAGGDGQKEAPAYFRPVEAADVPGRLRRVLAAFKSGDGNSLGVGVFGRPSEALRERLRHQAAEDRADPVLNRLVPFERVTAELLGGPAVARDPGAALERGGYLVTGCKDIAAAIVVFESDIMQAAGYLPPGVPQATRSRLYALLAHGPLSTAPLDLGRDFPPLASGSVADALKGAREALTRGHGETFSIALRTPLALPPH